MSDTKRIIFCIFFPALILIAALSLTGFFPFVDRGIYDRFLKIKADRHPAPPSPRIVPVDLDDTSIYELEEAIDSRRAFADLLQVLDGCASAVALDFVFRNPLEGKEFIPGGPFPAADGDAELVRAAAKTRRLVLAVIPVPEKLANISHGNLDAASRALLRKNLWHIRETGKSAVPEARSFIMSFPALSETAAQLGHIGVQQDNDGVFRKIPLFYRWEDGLIPSLALAAAVLELGVDTSLIEFHPGRALILPLGEDRPVIIPVDRAGCVRIPYTMRWTDNLYRLSFAGAVKAMYDDRAFEEIFTELAGSVCLVADTSTYTQDFGVSPIEAVFPRSGMYQAVMSGILDNSFYHEYAMGLKIILCILYGAAALFLNLRKRDLVFNTGFSLLFFFSAASSYLFWRFFSLVPWYGMPAFLILFCGLGGFIFRQFSRYRERLLFKNALERYFPRPLAQRISSEGSLDLAPAYRELSILFADIAGFTKWSADKGPDVVHGFLNHYLESMAAVIFEHGGTIDKFMGDGVMAFFGDPFEQNDHADRAVKTAVAMQKKIACLRDLWMPRIGIDLKVRIGINTGKVIAGNLGTRTRIEYTVIGAAVNLGQRMESSAPPGGILVSGDTRRLIRAPVRFGSRQLVTVKGYDEPVECYEVTG
ncbi:MAG: adenylate/guanylate cyclase domain-containing protein [Treponema sp.]|nr:adenylate/guanylate cyclase domain-containing protein [Treponema sp.]